VDSFGSPDLKPSEQSLGAYALQEEASALNTPSFQSLNGSQTRSSSPSDHRGGDNASKAPRPSLPGLVDFRVEATDDDSDLIVLGKQFEDAITEIRALYDPASPDDHLNLIEDVLVSLEPIEQAIMAIPARTIAGLGVKARHAAHVVSEYWDAPIDQIDWDARAVRFLIEAVCNLARTPLSFESNLKEDE
jgi:hypothetical protein